MYSKSKKKVLILTLLSVASYYINQRIPVNVICLFDGNIDSIVEKALPSNENVKDTNWSEIPTKNTKVVGKVWKVKLNVGIESSPLCYFGLHPKSSILLFCLFSRAPCQPSHSSSSSPPCYI
jgi:hypothetical protein